MRSSSPMLANATPSLALAGFVWGLLAASSPAQAEATSQPLVDACLEWRSDFCNGDVSDIPGYGPGVAVFHEENPSEQIGQAITVMINKGVSNTFHQLFACPEPDDDLGGGFKGCMGLGAFQTDENGQGHYRWYAEDPVAILGCTYDVLAINVHDLGTIIATPMKADLFPCPR